MNGRDGLRRRIIVRQDLQNEINRTETKRLDLGGHFRHTAGPFDQCGAGRMLAHEGEEHAHIVFKGVERPILGLTAGCLFKRRNGVIDDGDEKRLLAPKIVLQQRTADARCPADLIDRHRLIGFRAEEFQSDLEEGKAAIIRGHASFRQPVPAVSPSAGRLQKCSPFPGFHYYVST